LRCPDQNINSYQYPFSGEEEEEEGVRGKIYGSMASVRVGVVPGHEFQDPKS